jgi:riboflavin synthase
VFTGIVEALGRVTFVGATKAGRRISVAVPWPVKLGESVAVNGTCLTAIASHPSTATFDVIPESLKRTNLGRVKRGDGVNLERSLAAGGRFGGHFVQGHVDGTARVTAVTRSKGAVTMRVEVDHTLATLMVAKGYVALDGVSLTLVEVGEEFFTVALIPTTLKLTTLGRAARGALVNVEVDILGKYVAKIAGGRARGVTRNLLARAGFVGR